MPSWKEVVSKLDPSDYRILRETNPDRNLIGENPYLPSGNEMRDFLYLYDMKKLPADRDFSRYSFLLFSSEETVSEKSLKEAGRRFQNCIFIPDPEKWDDVNIQIHKVFTVYHIMNETLVKMQQMVKDDLGLQKLINIVAETLGTSVDLMDPSFRFIVVSDYPDERLPMHQKYAHPGQFLPAHFMKEMKQKGELKTLISMTREVNMHHEKYTSWFVPVMIHGMNAGYLIAFEKPDESEQKVRDWFLPYLPYFADIIGIEMGKEGIRSASKSQYFNYILSGLLEGSRTPFDTMKSMLAIYDYELQEHVFLILVQKEKARKRDILITADSLKNVFYNSIYTIKKDRICFLVSRKRENLFHNDYRTICEQFFVSNQLYGVMVGPFHDLENASDYRECAELILNWKIREKKHGFYDFADYQMEAMLEKVRQTKPLQLFCYRPVLNLLQYDRENDTQLLRTLEVYLNGNKKTETICQKLSISKAALYKRLDRIREIMETDFNTAEMQTKILITIHILRMEKKIL